MADQENIDERKMLLIVFEAEKRVSFDLQIE